MDKKAVEMQFHWMYVLFAGAIILLLFVTFIIRETKTSEQLIQADVTKKLEALFIGALASPKTSFQLNLPKTELLFTCEKNPENDRVFSEWRVKESEFSSPLDSFVLFSPKEIIGKNLVTFALDWEAPFKAGNFLYLTSPQIRYSFIYSENNQDSYKLAQALSQIIPKSTDPKIQLINRQFAYIEDPIEPAKLKVPEAAPKGIVRPSDNIREVIAFLNFDDEDEIKKYRPDELLKKYADDKDSIRIISIKGDENKGTAAFYDYEFKEGRSIQKGQPIFELKEIGEEETYAGMASLLGAIFAENTGNYECNMAKACGNIDNILSIYQKEAEKLGQTNSAVCTQLYGQFNFNRNGVDCIEYLSDNYEKFIQTDRQLQINSCPLIY